MFVTLGRAPLELEREPGGHVERALVQLEAERLVRVSARVGRVRRAPCRRPRAVRQPRLAFRLGGPRREHRRVYRHGLLLQQVIKY